MFEHRNAVGSCKGDGATRAPFADDHGNQRHADLQAHFGRAGNCLGLAAFFCALAGVGTGGVDQRDDRQSKTTGHFHQSNGLAVTFGARHAKVVVDARFGVMTFLMPNHHDRLVTKTRQTAHHREVIGKVPVAGQGRVLGEQLVDVIAAMRTVGVTRHLAFPPGRQILVEILKKLRRFGIQRAGFGLDIHFFI